MPKLKSIVVVSALLAACTSLPCYTAPFSAVDQNRDGVIEWREFKIHYSDTVPTAFMQADHNKDGDVTSEEWQYFVETQTP